MPQHASPGPLAIQLGLCKAKCRWYVVHGDTAERLVRGAGIYSRDFFGLQLQFASRAQVLSDLSLEESLLRHTNLYVRLGCGRGFDPEHPRWQEYVAGLTEDSSPLDWTMSFYGRDAETQTAPPTDRSVGCFSASINAAEVRIHFRDTGAMEESSLSVSHADTRRAELGQLFGSLQSVVSAVTPVVGASWLYNLDAYRRLFPPSYIASARTLWDRYRSMPLWGQFIDRRGALREPQVTAFRSAVAATTSLDRLSQCFPLQVVTVSAPARDFYEHYA